VIPNELRDLLADEPYIGIIVNPNGLSMTFDTDNGYAVMVWEDEQEYYIVDSTHPDLYIGNTISVNELLDIILE
jgi:hypothetical protein